MARPNASASHCTCLVHVILCLSLRIICQIRSKVCRRWVADIVVCYYQCGARQAKSAKMLTWIVSANQAVILQIVANARKIKYHGNIELIKKGCRSNTRELKQLR